MIEILLSIARDVEADPQARIKAAERILERGLGRPMQTGDEHRPALMMAQVEKVQAETAAIKRDLDEAATGADRKPIEIKIINFDAGESGEPQP